MWEIRRASLADRDRLVSLCVAAAGSDDWPIEDMDEMILRGVWHIATDGDRIAGGIHYRETIDNGAWLSAARTHPDYRRQGVASAILESFVGLARRSGVGPLRLWSAASNHGGNASAKSAGFHEVARFTLVQRAADHRPMQSHRVAYDETLTRRLGTSQSVQGGHGYVGYDWAFLPLTSANVHQLANRGALRAVRAGIVCIGPRADLGGFEFETAIADGDVATMLRALPQLARAEGCREVHTFLPHRREFLEAARRAGFEEVPWGREAVLYERPIESRTVPVRRRPTYAEVAARQRGGHGGPTHGSRGDGMGTPLHP